MSDKPTRLRRTPFGAGPAVGTVLGGTVISKPLEIQDVPGHVRGSSNDANERDAGQAYEDTADVTKVESARVNEKAPFTLTK